MLFRHENLRTNAHIRNASRFVRGWIKTCPLYLITFLLKEVVGTGYIYITTYRRARARDRWKGVGRGLEGVGRGVGSFRRPLVEGVGRG